jgi:hypothetical protein
MNINPRSSLDSGSIIQKIAKDWGDTEKIKKYVPQENPNIEDEDPFAQARDNIVTIQDVYTRTQENQNGEGPQPLLNLMEKRWTVLSSKFALLIDLKGYLEETHQDSDEISQYLEKTAAQIASFDEMFDDPLFQNSDFRDLVKKNLLDDDKLELQQKLNATFKSYLKFKVLEKLVAEKKESIDEWKKLRNNKDLPSRVDLDKEIKEFVELQAQIIKESSETVKRGRQIINSMRQNAIEKGHTDDLVRIDNNLIPRGKDWALLASKSIKALRSEIKKEYKNVVDSREAVALDQGRVWNFLNKVTSKFAGPDPFEKFPREMAESWNLTSWGNLLQRGDNGDFVVAVDKLKQRNRDLKLELRRLKKSAKLPANRDKASSAEKIAKSKEAVKNELNANKIVMHHMIIMQSVKQIRMSKIDQIAGSKELKETKEELQAARSAGNVEKTAELEQKVRTLQVKIERSEEDIRLLESAFAHYFTKYTKDYKKIADKGLLGKTFAAIKELIPGISNDLPTPPQLYREKTYAQFGKERVEYVKEHLKRFTDVLGVQNGVPTLKDSGAATNWVKDTITGFTEWSSRHPEEAVILTADILHTINEAQGAGAFNAFSGRLTALSYVCSNFAQLRVHEPITNEEDLLYFALADYAPVVLTGVSMSKGAKDGYQLGAQVGRDLGLPVAPMAFGMAMAVAGGVLNVAKTTAIRELSNKIDIESAPIVNVITGIMSEDQVYNVVEAQQTEAIKEIAFGAVSAVTEKGYIKSFVKETWSQMKIWWNSVGKSTSPIERSLRLWTQRILPAVGAAVAGFFFSPAGATAALVLGGMGPIGWGVMALVGTITISWYAYRALNSVYKESIKKAQEDEIRNVLTSGENLKQHNKLVGTYIRDLKQTGLLPDLKAPSKEAQKEIAKYKAIIDKTRDRLLKNLNDELGMLPNKGEGISAKKYAKMFAKHLNVKAVREQLEGDIGKVFGKYMEKDLEEGVFISLPGVELIEIGVEKIISDLEAEWLLPKVDKALEDETYQVYINTGKEEALVAQRLAAIAPRPTLQKRMETRIKEELGRSLAIADDERETVERLMVGFNADRFKRHAQVEPSAPDREMLSPI